MIWDLSTEVIRMDVTKVQPLEDMDKMGLLEI